MKVAELIAQLQEMPADAQVVVQMGVEFETVEEVELDDDTDVRLILSFGMNDGEIAKALDE